MAYPSFDEQWNEVTNHGVVEAGVGIVDGGGDAAGGQLREFATEAQGNAGFATKLDGCQAAFEAK